MTTTGEVLKPCAKCGMKHQLSAKPSSNVDGHWCVWCYVCHIGVYAQTKPDVIAAWNDRRAPQGNAAQEGYVLVPTRATEEMRMYGQSAYDHAVATMPALANRTAAIAVAYATMIAAAPSNKEVER